MKIFIYKTLFVLVCLIFLFQFTIGSKLNQIEQNILQLKSKENIENAKDKIRLEIKSLEWSPYPDRVSTGAIININGFIFYTL